ncbi:ribosomal protein L18 [Ordospora colligata]|uniref:Ribosomal protein L18 n=1 Tax=Ordospora colligata OC4 TaxID=1354746 RepID=A0A0B2UL59_9MICR|nr:ribosomal protein L18 [Ordospora colligata OC4]KHN70039.1 ribosomal protein L18 [Ordospora colligata OC4]TBU16421.1 ribosomal protein L18 [Ordospora colligata]TBU16606.1 ribosomal protein L18 [Ordospora colligata]TBU19179.1 ribosomal protein L18 [Ordospora colligata]
MYSTSIKKFERLPSSAVTTKKCPNSANVYLKALSRFYSKIARNTSYLCLKKISKRLTMSKSDRQPVKISKIVSELEGKQDKVAVVVAKVLDDDKVMILPAMKIVALQWSKEVKEKVEKYGGSIHTLDELFKVCADMDNVCLVSTDKFSRKSAKFWGPAPGERGSKTYPKGNLRCHNREKRVMMKGRKPKNQEINQNE